MIELVSFDDAKFHLRIIGEEEDADIERLVLTGSSIVLDYLKTTPEAATLRWTTGDPPTLAIPWVVQAATLLVIGEIYRERESESDPLSAGARALLHRQRDPALA